MATASNSKRGRPKDEVNWANRTDAILDTAARIFADQGYQGTEMQDIADALQVAKGTLYRYFDSKEDLFLKAVSRGMTRLREAVDASGGGIDDPLEMLAKAIHAYLEFFRSHPEYTELLILERAQFKDSKEHTYFINRNKHSGRWRDLYAALIAEGRLRDVPPQRILDVIQDLVYGTMFTNHFTGRHKPLADQARDLVDIFFHGILSDSERQQREETDKF